MPTSDEIQVEISELERQVQQVKDTARYSIQELTGLLDDRKHGKITIHEEYNQEIYNANREIKARKMELSVFDAAVSSSLDTRWEGTLLGRRFVDLLATAEVLTSEYNLARLQFIEYNELPRDGAIAITQKKQELEAALKEAEKSPQKIADEQREHDESQSYIQSSINDKYTERDSAIDRLRVDIKALEVQMAEAKKEKLVDELRKGLPPQISPTDKPKPGFETEPGFETGNTLNYLQIQVYRSMKADRNGLTEEKKEGYEKILARGDETIAPDPYAAQKVEAMANNLSKSRLSAVVRGFGQGMASLASHAPTTGHKTRVGSPLNQRDLQGVTTQNRRPGPAGLERTKM